LEANLRVGHASPWKVLEVFAFFIVFPRFCMRFQEGDKIPSVELFEDSPANKINIAELSANKKIILFAVPGAFTP
jgi:hypothetical protein